MLRFTEEQERFVLANRQAFNDSQRAMASRFGLANGTSLGASALGNATVLPKDVWGEWDREALEVQRTSLAVFSDLAASVSTPMPLGKLVKYFQIVSDSGSVNVSLDGRSKARTDQPLIDYAGTPLPIYDSTYSYGWRQMLAAESEGFQVDAAARDNANRRVAEALENSVLNGNASIAVNGQVLLGLRNHPRRNTRATGVTLLTATGAQWYAEMLATIRLLHNDNFRTPPTIYLNWNDWFYASTTDYSTAYPNKTIAQRLMETNAIASMVPAHSLNANEIIALVKDRRVVQVLNGMPQTTRAQFRANPEDDYNFVVMAAAAVELKYDYNLQMGLAVSS